MGNDPHSCSCIGVVVMVSFMIRSDINSLSVLSVSIGREAPEMFHCKGYHEFHFPKLGSHLMFLFI